MKNMFVVGFVATVLLFATTCPRGEADPGWKNSLSPRGPAGPELTLAVAGKTTYSILLPARPTTQEVKAGEDLAHWLTEMTGAAFPVVREPPSGPAPPHVISVGRTALLKRAMPPQAALDLGVEGYAIAVKGPDLFLIGGTKRGPINAVYALLEEDLGCRWYSPQATVIPRVPNLRFRPVPRSFVPRLELRDPFIRDAFERDWSLHNRTRGSWVSIPPEWDGSYRFGSAGIGHSFASFVPGSGQLCLTDPNVVNAATDWAMCEAKAGAQIISVAQNDGPVGSIGPESQALNKKEGTPAAALIRFVNAIAEAVAGKYPGAKICTLAYHDSEIAPKTIKPRENVIVVFCTAEDSWQWPFIPYTQTGGVTASRLKGWDNLGAHLYIWDYVTNFSQYSIPMPNMKVVTENLRFLFSLKNLKGILLQGAYQSPGSDRGPMRSWVWAKQLWDPSLDTGELMHDFIYGYYGKAARPMEEYNLLVEKLGEDRRAEFKNPKLYSIRYDPDAPMLSRAFLDKASAVFDKAEQLADDKETLRRVKLTKFSLLCVKLCRGPGFTDDNYGQLVDEFEAIARKEKIQHLSEGTGNVEPMIKLWRGLASFDPKKVAFHPWDSQWKFKTDRKDVGMGEEWYNPHHNDADWSNILGGKSWETQGVAGYTGVGWYRQRFKVPAGFDARKYLWLVTESTDVATEIFINGQKAFAQTIPAGPMQERQLIYNGAFKADIRPFLKPGQENLIAIRARSNYLIAGGGLWKPLYLVSSDQEVAASALTAFMNPKAAMPR